MKIRIVMRDSLYFQATNAETGEPIEGIVKARLVLDQGEWPMAEITFAIGALDCVTLRGIDSVSKQPVREKISSHDATNTKQQDAFDREAGEL